jgi:hypothetical protein
MIDPSGPLPPAIYWRRRVLAVAASVVAVVLLAWIIGQLVDGTEEQPVQDASARASQPPSSRPSAPSSSPGAPSSTAAPAPVVAIPAPPLPSQPPQACPDAVIAVLAQTDQPGYRVGQRPLLRLVIANSGQVACLRDVSRSLRELVITTPDGAKRLWSSNDCFSPPGGDTRLIQPGEQLTFTVTWAGRTSAPGCPSRRRTVPAGSYLVTGKLGALAGAPVPILLT